MSDIVERIAKVIATCVGDSAMKHNLSEIGQSDQFDGWRAIYPIKVTDHDRALARAVITELVVILNTTNNSSLNYAAEELQEELDETA